MNQVRVLHIDDDLFFLESLQTALSGPPANFVVTSTQTIADFSAELENGHYPIVIIDIRLGKQAAGTTGIDLVAQVKEQQPTAMILMCSSECDATTIQAAMRQGAYDFITKANDPTALLLRVIKTYEHYVQLQSYGDANGSLGLPFVGKSLQVIAKQVAGIIDSAVSTIHVFGPSGAGKEAVADTFAHLLPAATPFVRINCGALSATLLESELFGHAKGAFTGAGGAKQGLIEAAHGGFIFLDEIATLSDQAQVALLRVIENKTVRRVGENTDRQVDVRIVSATNQNLPALVAAGKFRNDLWQRLSEVVIELPPLRERKDEVPQLIDLFLKDMRGGPYTIAPAARAVLESYDWAEGNVRELRNCLRAMTAFSLGQELTALAIPRRVFEAGSPAPLPQVTAPSTTDRRADQAPAAAQPNSIAISWRTEFPDYEDLCSKLLVELIRHHYHSHGRGSLRNFAKVIGVSRSTLSARLKSIMADGKLTGEQAEQWLGLKAG